MMDQDAIDFSFVLRILSRLFFTLPLQSCVKRLFSSSLSALVVSSISGLLSALSMINEYLSLSATKLSVTDSAFHFFLIHGIHMDYLSNSELAGRHHLSFPDREFLKGCSLVLKVSRTQL